MNPILPFVLLFLVLLTNALVAAPHDVHIRKVNAAGTAFEEVILPDPGADSFFRFNNATNTVDYVSGSLGDFSDGGDTAGANRTLGNNDAFDLGLETGGTTRLHLEGDGTGATAGNIGIATTTPQGLLDIRGGAAAPGVLYLATDDTDVTDGETLGSIFFNAPAEASGSQAILPSAKIYAEADGTYGAAANDVDLIFATSTGTSSALEQQLVIGNDRISFYPTGTTFPTFNLQVTGGIEYATLTDDTRLGFSSSSNAGYNLMDTFLTRVNVNEMGLGESAQTDESILHLFDGGADNEPGVLAQYNDAGTRYSLIVDTDGNLRFGAGAVADDDTFGTVLDMSNSFSYGSWYIDTSLTADAAAGAEKLGADSGSTTTGTTSSDVDDNSVEQRLRYTGEDTKLFLVKAQFNCTHATGGTTVTFDLRKNGTLITGSAVSQKVLNANDLDDISVAAIVSLATNDYVEIYVDDGLANAAVTTVSQGSMQMFSLDGFGFDPSGWNSLTWGDNTQASLEWTFDTSSINDVNIDMTDNTFTVDVGNVVIDQNLTVTGTTNANAVRSEFVPIGWANDGAVPPGVLETFSDTRKVDIRKFSSSVTEDVELFWQIPEDAIDADTGTAEWQLKYRVIYIVTEATGPSAEGVSFNLQGVPIADNEDIGAATLGTVAESDDASTTAVVNDLLYSDWVEITLTGAVAGEGSFFKFERDHDDTVDTYAQDIGVVGIEFKFKYNTGLAY